MNKIFGAFTDGANLFWGGLVAIYTHFIGGRLPVFVLLFALNVIDVYYGRHQDQYPEFQNWGGGCAEEGGLLGDYYYFLLHRPHSGHLFGA